MSSMAESETYDPTPSPIALRNMTGDRNDVKMLARNVRRYCSHRDSTTRPIVVERRAALGRPPDEDRLGVEPALVHGYPGRLSVVGIQQDPVGQVLHALGDPVELSVQRL